MPIQEMMLIQKSGSREANLKLLLAMHCAPLLKGLTIANVLTLSREEALAICRLLNDTDISCYFLCADKKRAVLFLYRERELLAYLHKEGVKEFLKEYGYCEITMCALMRRLSEQVKLYHNKETEFPHEIGIFLGYPISDVKGFIKNKGQNCKYLGYWKVYDNVREAVKIFCRFDEERECAVRDVIMGKPICEIAV